jgi:mTERF domain-containing protein, mitochondrial
MIPLKLHRVMDRRGRNSYQWLATMVLCGVPLFAPFYNCLHVRFMVPYPAAHAFAVTCLSGQLSRCAPRNTISVFIGSDDVTDEDDDAKVLPIPSMSTEWDDEWVVVEDQDDEFVFQSSVELLGNASSSFVAAPLTLDQLSEAFAANVSYFYLKNELQLSDTAMWRITYEASSALGMTTAVVRHKIEVLQATMNLTSDDICTILERQPTILHLSADKNIAPTLLFLLRALGLGRDELRHLVVTCPAILCYSISNLKSKIRFFSECMKFTTDECRELLLRKPELFRSSVQTGLVPHFQFLTDDMEIPPDQLQRIVQKSPVILLYSLEQNLVPKLVYYMIMRLQMNTAQIAKLLLAFPQILDYHLDRTILPVTLYFFKELDVSEIEFRNILLKFPRLVTHSLRKIKRTIGYFRFELNMLPAQVKKVLYRAPAILGLSLERNIQPKVQYLQTSLKLSDEELHTVLAAMPSVLLLNSESNIRPKLEFLNATVHRISENHDISDVREIVMRLPTLLGYSLEKRIVPRMNTILEAGCEPSCITIGIPMTESDFNTWLHRRVRKRQRSMEVSEMLPAQTRPQLLLPPSSTIQSALTVAKKKNDGRIVHWVRERRPHL